MNRPVYCIIYVCFWCITHNTLVWSKLLVTITKLILMSLNLGIKIHLFRFFSPLTFWFLECYAFSVLQFPWVERRCRCCDSFQPQDKRHKKGPGPARTAMIVVKEGYRFVVSLHSGSRPGHTGKILNISIVAQIYSLNLLSIMVAMCLAILNFWGYLHFSVNIPLAFASNCHNEHTDHTLSSGRWGGEGKHCPDLVEICHGQEN